MSAAAPSGSLAGKCAIITGGDSGIGACTAVAFAREGADVAIAFRTDVEGAKKVKEQVEKQYGRKCVMVQGDLSREEDVKRLFDEALQAFDGRLDVLINNASYEQRGEWETFSLEDFNRILTNNVSSSFLCSREALRRGVMKAGGRILFTGSIQGLEGSPTDPAYSASKGAMHTMTKSLAKYLAERKILVNAVAPGPVNTPMLQENTPEHLKTDGGSKYPLGVAQPESIAESFVFLASKAGDYYSGEILKPTSGKVTAG